MSSVDLDLDSQMRVLESEWRQAYEAGNAAREQLQALCAMPKPNEFTLGKAYDRLERAEEWKARIMAKIEKLEDANARAGRNWKDSAMRTWEPQGRTSS